MLADNATSRTIQWRLSTCCTRWLQPQHWPKRTRSKHSQSRSRKTDPGYAVVHRACLRSPILSAQTCAEVCTERLCKPSDVMAWLIESAAETPSRVGRARFPFCRRQVCSGFDGPDGRYAAKRFDPAEEPTLNRRRNAGDESGRSRETSDLAFHLAPLLGIVIRIDSKSSRSKIAQVVCAIRFASVKDVRAHSLFQRSSGEHDR